jgi:hypothetical protein
MPRVSQYTALTAATLDRASDVVPIVDSSAGATKKITVKDLVAAGQTVLFSGSGSPEGVVTASAPAIYIDLANTAEPKLYFKTSGTGNTGWV